MSLIGRGAVGLGGAALLAVLLATILPISGPCAAASAAPAPNAARLATLQARLEGPELVRVYGGFGRLEVRDVHLASEGVSWGRVTSWSDPNWREPPQLVAWPDVERIQQFRSRAGSTARMGGLIGVGTGLLFALAVQQLVNPGESPDGKDDAAGYLYFGLSFGAAGAGIGAVYGTLSKEWVTLYDANPAGAGRGR
jgi:hypothetical protein